MNMSREESSVNAAADIVQGDDAQTSLLDHNADGSTAPATGDSSATHTTPHVGTYGSFVAYCFGVNYVLGVGVLAIPHAFEAGGVAFGPICLFVVSLMAIITMMWVVETLARTEAWISADEADAKQKAASEHQQANYGSEITATAQDNVVQQEDAVSAGIENSNEGKELLHADEKGDNRFKITLRKFEMNEMCYIWLGRVGKIVYEICIALYLYGSLWSYASVFAQSVASHIPLPVGPSGHTWFTCNVYLDGSWNCTASYLIYIAVFTLFVVPMTCIDLSEQKLVQVLLAIFRFVALALMIFSIIYSIFTDPFSRSPNEPVEPVEKHPPYLSKFDLFNIAGLYKLLPVALFSQIFHHSLPGLCQPVSNKTHLQRIFSSVFMTTFTFYSFLGIVLAMYYGSHIEPTCSLNFTFYRGGAPFGQPIPVWAVIVNYIIVLFPAIDVVSAFPLNGITLGNNIHAAFCMNTKYMNYKSIKILFRLVAAIPPLIGAALVRDLSKILSYVGLVGFVITFVYPPLMHIVSMYKCNKRFGTSKTPWTFTVLSHWGMTIPVMITGVTAIIFCIVTNIIYS